jgi:adenosylcobinamide-phosphate synthase
MRGCDTELSAMTAVLMALAVALDWLLGKPPRWHPLAGFARLANWLEQRYYLPERTRGAIAAAALLLPPTLLAAELAELPGLWGAGFSLGTLVIVLGHKRLHAAVRNRVSGAGENQAGVSSACAQALENGGVFGALFWFLVAGAPGALLYRLAHTLHALWDDKHPRHIEFGWAAAQLDDMLGIVPGRLAALTFALLGRTRQALQCWREQASAWDNANAGPLLAAGAGALGICLGDRMPDQDEGPEPPPLGTGAAPAATDSERALRLVRHGVLLWLAVIGLGALAGWWLGDDLATLTLDWDRILNFLRENLLA